MVHRTVKIAYYQNLFCFVLILEYVNISTKSQKENKNENNKLRTSKLIVISGV